MLPRVPNSRDRPGRRSQEARSAGKEVTSEGGNSLSLPHSTNTESNRLGIFEKIKRIIHDSPQGDVCPEEDVTERAVSQPEQDSTNLESVPSEDKTTASPSAPQTKWRALHKTPAELSQKCSPDVGEGRDQTSPLLGKKRVKINRNFPIPSITGRIERKKKVSNGVCEVGTEGLDGEDPVEVQPAISQEEKDSKTLIVEPVQVHSSIKHALLKIPVTTATAKTPVICLNKVSMDTAQSHVVKPGRSEEERLGLSLLSSSELLVDTSLIPAETDTDSRLDNSTQVWTKREGEMLGVSPPRLVGSPQSDAILLFTEPETLPETEAEVAAPGEGCVTVITPSSNNPKTQEATAPSCTDSSKDDTNQPIPKSLSAKMDELISKCLKPKQTMCLEVSAPRSSPRARKSTSRAEDYLASRKKKRSSLCEPQASPEQKENLHTVKELHSPCSLPDKLTGTAPSPEAPIVCSSVQDALKKEALRGIKKELCKSSSPEGKLQAYTCDNLSAQKDPVDQSRPDVADTLPVAAGHQEQTSSDVTGPDITRPKLGWSRLDVSPPKLNKKAKVKSLKVKMEEEDFVMLPLSKECNWRSLCREIPDWVGVDLALSGTSNIKLETDTSPKAARVKRPYLSQPKSADSVMKDKNENLFRFTEEEGTSLQKIAIDVVYTGTQDLKLKNGKPKSCTPPEVKVGGCKLEESPLRSPRSEFELNLSLSGQESSPETVIQSPVRSRSGRAIKLTSAAREAGLAHESTMSFLVGSSGGKEKVKGQKMLDFSSEPSGSSRENSPEKNPCSPTLKTPKVKKKQKISEILSAGKTEGGGQKAAGTKVSPVITSMLCSRMRQSLTSPPDLNPDSKLSPPKKKSPAKKRTIRQILNIKEEDLNIEMPPLKTGIDFSKCEPGKPLVIVPKTEPDTCPVRDESDASLPQPPSSNIDKLNLEPQVPDRDEQSNIRVCSKDQPHLASSSVINEQRERSIDSPLKSPHVSGDENKRAGNECELKNTEDVTVNSSTSDCAPVPPSPLPKTSSPIPKTPPLPNLSSLSKPCSPVPDPSSLSKPCSPVPASPPPVQAVEADGKKHPALTSLIAQIADRIKTADTAGDDLCDDDSREKDSEESLNTSRENQSETEGYANTSSEQHSTESSSLDVSTDKDSNNTLNTSSDRDKNDSPERGIVEEEEEQKDKEEVKGSMKDGAVVEDEASEAATPRLAPPALLKVEKVEKEEDVQASSTSPVEVDEKERFLRQLQCLDKLIDNIKAEKRDADYQSVMSRREGRGEERVREAEPTVRNTTCVSEREERGNQEEDNPHTMFERPGPPDKKKADAFVSTELEKYLTTNSEVQQTYRHNPQLFKHPDLPTGRPIQVVTGPRNLHTGEPEVDEIDGVVFLSFDTEKDLGEYTKLTGSTMPASRSRPHPTTSTDDLKPSDKTQDLTKIKGWKKKFTSTESPTADTSSLLPLTSTSAKLSPTPEGAINSMLKIHWRTKERLLRNLTSEEITVLGLSLKRRRLGRKGVCHKKGAKKRQERVCPLDPEVIGTPKPAVRRTLLPKLNLKPVTLTSSMVLNAMEALVASSDNDSEALSGVSGSLLSSCHLPGCRWGCQCSLPQGDVVMIDSDSSHTVGSQPACGREYCRMGCICDCLDDRPLPSHNTLNTKQPAPKLHPPPSKTRDTEKDPNFDPKHFGRPQLKQKKRKKKHQNAYHKQSNGSMSLYSSDSHDSFFTSHDGPEINDTKPSQDGLGDPGSVGRVEKMGKVEVGDELVDVDVTGDNVPLCGKTDSMSGSVENTASTETGPAQGAYLSMFGLAKKCDAEEGKKEGESVRKSSRLRNRRGIGNIDKLKDLIYFDATKWVDDGLQHLKRKMPKKSSSAAAIKKRKTSESRPATPQDGGKPATVQQKDNRRRSISDSLPRPDRPGSSLDDLRPEPRYVRSRHTFMDWSREGKRQQGVVYTIIRAPINIMPQEFKQEEEEQQEEEEDQGVCARSSVYLNNRRLRGEQKPALVGKPKGARGQPEEKVVSPGGEKSNKHPPTAHKSSAPAAPGHGGPRPHDSLPPKPVEAMLKNRKQMILLQRDYAMQAQQPVRGRPPALTPVLGEEGHLPHLLEIQSNCDWGSIRSLLLHQVSIIADRNDLPPEGHKLCRKILEYTIEIRPPPKEPTPLPTDLRTKHFQSLPAIRIMISKTEEEGGKTGGGEGGKQGKKSPGQQKPHSRPGKESEGHALPSLPAVIQAAESDGPAPIMIPKDQLPLISGFEGLSGLGKLKVSAPGCLKTTGGSILPSRERRLSLDHLSPATAGTSGGGGLTKAGGGLPQGVLLNTNTSMGNLTVSSLSDVLMAESKAGPSDSTPSTSPYPKLITIKPSSKEQVAACLPVIPLGTPPRGAPPGAMTARGFAPGVYPLTIKGGPQPRMTLCSPTGQSIRIPLSVLQQSPQSTGVSGQPTVLIRMNAGDGSRVLSGIPAVPLSAASGSGVTSTAAKSSVDVTQSNKSSPPTSPKMKAGSTPGSNKKTPEKGHPSQQTESERETEGGSVRSKSRSSSKPDNGPSMKHMEGASPERRSPGEPETLSKDQEQVGGVEEEEGDMFPSRFDDPELSPVSSLVEDTVQIISNPPSDEDEDYNHDDHYQHDEADTPDKQSENTFSTDIESERNGVKETNMEGDVRRRGEVEEKTPAGLGDVGESEVSEESSLHHQTRLGRKQDTEPEQIVIDNSSDEEEEEEEEEEEVVVVGEDMSGEEEGNLISTAADRLKKTTDWKRTRGGAKVAENSNHSPIIIDSGDSDDSELDVMTPEEDPRPASQLLSGAPCGQDGNRKVVQGEVKNLVTKLLRNNTRQKRHHRKRSLHDEERDERMAVYPERKVVRDGVVRDQHVARERERRLDLVAKFSELQRAVPKEFLPKNHFEKLSKQALLTGARKCIHHLTRVGQRLQEEKNQQLTYRGLLVKAIRTMKGLKGPPSSISMKPTLESHFEEVIRKHCLGLESKPCQRGAKRRARGEEWRGGKRRKDEAGRKARDLEEEAVPEGVDTTHTVENTECEEDPPGGSTSPSLTISSIYSLQAGHHAGPAGQRPGPVPETVSISSESIDDEAPSMLEDDDDDYLSSRSQSTVNDD